MRQQLRRHAKAECPRVRGTVVDESPSPHARPLGDTCAHRRRGLGAGCDGVGRESAASRCATREAGARVDTPCAGDVARFARDGHVVCAGCVWCARDVLGLRSRSRDAGARCGRKHRADTLPGIALRRPGRRPRERLSIAPPAVPFLSRGAPDSSGTSVSPNPSRGAGTEHRGARAGVPGGKVE